MEHDDRGLRRGDERRAEQQTEGQKQELRLRTASQHHGCLYQNFYKLLLLLLLLLNTDPALVVLGELQRQTEGCGVCLCCYITGDKC